MLSETCLTIPAFVFRRSSRDMPGFLAMPAVTTTISEFARLVVAIGADDSGVEAFDRRRLPLIESLSLRNSLHDVDENYLAGQLFFSDTLRGRCADIARADDRNLVDHFAC